MAGDAKSQACAFLKHEDRVSDRAGEALPVQGLCPPTWTPKPLGWGTESSHSRGKGATLSKTPFGKDGEGWNLPLFAPSVLQVKRYRCHILGGKQFPVVLESVDCGPTLPASSPGSAIVQMTWGRLPFVPQFPHL